MNCECYTDEYGNYHECPKCEHDRFLEIETQERILDAVENRKPIGQ